MERLLSREGALLGKRFLPALVRKDFSNSDLELQLLAMYSISRLMA